VKINQGNSVTLAAQVAQGMAKSWRVTIGGACMDGDDFLRTLKAKEEIQAVLVEYARAQDNKDWGALEALLAEDVRGEYGGIEVVDGRANLIAQHSRYLNACGPTQHMLSNFRIAVRGNRASSACYVRAMHAGKGAKSGAIYDLWGEYRDDLVQTDTGWHICRRIEQTFHVIGDISFFQL
jgi:hypothetical protein